MMRRNNTMKKQVTMENSRQTKLEEFGFIFTEGETNE